MIPGAAYSSLVSVKGMVILIIVTLFFAGGWVFAPFPYWPTYFLLWKNILLNREKSIHPRSRFRQAAFLFKHLLFAPFGTLLWFLDEIFFPGYKQMRHKSVFIIGEPRSGTTFIHRTLAADENTFFAIRHIEWRYPYITLQKLIHWLRLDRKFKNSDYWPDTAAGRQASAMHKNTLYDWEEDAIFFEECFLHHLFISFRIPFPNLITRLDDFTLLPEKTQQHMILTYRKVVRKVQYLRGANKIYLSKEVAGQRKLPQIVRHYPEATFMLVARSSRDFMGSIQELVKVSTFVKTGVDVSAVPGWEAMFFDRMRDDCTALLDFLSRIDSDRQIHLAFHPLLEQIVPSLRYVYDRLGLTLGPDYLQYLERLQKRQQVRQRAYDYQVQGVRGFKRYDDFVGITEQNHRNILRGQIAQDN